MLSHTSRDWAPWYVVPADHQWFTHLATAAVLVHTLVTINPQYPTVDPGAWWMPEPNWWPTLAAQLPTEVGLDRQWSP